MVASLPSNKPVSASSSTPEHVEHNCAPLPCISVNQRTMLGYLPISHSPRATMTDGTMITSVESMSSMDRSAEIGIPLAVCVRPRLGATISTLNGGSLGTASL